MLWTTGVFLLCALLASAFYLSADEGQDNLQFSNIAAVILVGVGAIFFVAGIVGKI